MLRKTYFISLIVSIYNVKEYLEDCIKSICNQTFKNIEILLVNDGSKDSSLEICYKFANIDNRIKIINKSNGGLSSARNAGLDVATGDFVMFIDGDDYIAENTVENLIKLVSKYNCDIIQFDYIETTDEYNNQSAVLSDDVLLVDDSYKMFEKLYDIGGPAASACTKLYKKYLFDNLRFKNGINNEDEQMITFMLQKAKSVLYTNFKPYYYITRQGSIINSGFSKKRLDILYILEERKEELSKLCYYDFVQKENNRIYMTLINFWCEANAKKDKICKNIITDKFKHFLVNEKITIKGKFNFIYKLCKLNYRFIYLYYLYKKLAKQV